MIFMTVIQLLACTILRQRINFQLGKMFFINQSLKGSETLNSQGIYKHKIYIKSDETREGIETLSLEYFIDKKRTQKVAEESIKLIDTSYEPDDDDQDPNKPYRLEASRPQVKEN